MFFINNNRNCTYCNISLFEIGENENPSKVGERGSFEELEILKK